MSDCIYGLEDSGDGHNGTFVDTLSKDASSLDRDKEREGGGFVVGERVRVVILCFLSFILCNVDRINVSVAILPMAEHYHWNQTTRGLIQSAFFYGYVLTQIPGGYLADKFGGKQVLSFGVVAWSLMTLITPWAASTNLGVLLAARALLGVGEGVAMPAMNQMISRWVPKEERGRSLSLIYSGM